MSSNRNETRLRALRVMTRVLSDSIQLDTALEEISADLNAEDRAFCTEWASGVLRWKGRLDLAIDAYATKKKPTGWLRKALQLGAYQLIVQERVPPAWVVSETVDLIRAKEGEHPAKFANALLRRISESRDQWSKLDPRSLKSVGEKAAAASMPLWMWNTLVKDYGEQWVSEFAQASLARPSIWLSSRSSHWTPPKNAVQGSIPNSWKLTEGGQVRSIPGFEQGEFIVQDLSSQRLIEEGVALLGPQSNGKTALDLCAAPGGKTVGLAWRGLKVAACDRGVERLSLLKQTVARTRVSVTMDSSASELGRNDQYDLVWVDAPCTGSGVIRRHPDIRWLKKEIDLKSLEQTQLELIQAGWKKLKPGGVFIYSVCSLFKAEGKGRIEGARLPAQELKRWLLVPGQFEGDGFWAWAGKKVEEAV